MRDRTAQGRAAQGLDVFCIGNSGSVISKSPNQNIVIFFITFCLSQVITKEAKNSNPLGINTVKMGFL